MNQETSKKTTERVATSVSALGLILIFATVATAGDLTGYRATYRKKLEEIVLTHGMKATALQQDYTASLSNLFERTTQAGDLNKVKMVLAERTRLSKEPLLTEVSIVTNGFRELAGMQSTFINSLKALETEKSKSIILLSDQYRAALEPLQIDLTRRKLISEAMVVQEELTKMAEAQISAANPAAEFSELAKARAYMKAPGIPGTHREQPSNAVPEKTTASTPVSPVFDKGFPVPVLWLKCEAIENGQIPDSSPCGNNAGLYNVKPDDIVSAGNNNKALRLEGSYLEIPDSESLRLAKKGYTLTIWCCPDQIGVSAGVLLSKRKGYYNTEYGFEVTKGGSLFVYGDTETFQPIKAKKWCHIAVVLDPKNMDDPKKLPLKVFVNGHEEKCKGRPERLFRDDDCTVQIGHAFNPAYGGYFKGLVDDIRIYDKPLSAQQISILYNAPPAQDLRAAR